jgi:putative endonuclease
VLIGVSAGHSVAAMTTDLRHQLGHQGERLAADHLQRLGYRVLARRYRTRFGELDLIVSDERCLVFCEVKTRRQGTGRPWDALTPAKQAQVRRMAAAWLVEATDRPHADDLRFDAIGVVVDARGRLVSLDHLEAAF